MPDLRGGAFLLLLLLGGCDRACAAVVHREDARPPDLGGTDCSDGLARCVGGHVEVSRIAHLPHPCGRPGERSCSCPWDTVGACSSGCAFEGTVVVATAGVARTQLCRPGEIVARPVTALDPPAAGVCTDEGVTCVDGQVRVCTAGGQPIRVVAICTNGCEAAVGLAEGETPPLVQGRDVDGATAILCRRHHAERQ